MGPGEKLSAKRAIARVLAEAEGPLKVPAIIAAAVPLTNLGGKTPVRRSTACSMRS